MKTSVLMSVYKNDRPEWLSESLESVFLQTVPPDEVVLVEDGPVCSGLQEVIADFAAKQPSLKIISLPQNLGLGLALNEGLKHCSNEIIVRMDSDDICYPTRIEKLLDVFRKFPNVDAISSWIDEFINTPDNIVSTRKLPEYPYELNLFAKSRSPLNHAASAFKKSSIQLAGGYKHFSLYEDYYLWARMLCSGCHIYNIQESLLYVRASEDMYNRRGGWKYAKSSVKFLHTLKQMNFISAYQMCKLSLIRFTVCMMPNSVRKWFYTKFLR